MRQRSVLVVLLLLGALGAAPAAEAQLVRDAQEEGRRLVLKDGSYQPARSWEVQGERVRFYSTDRRQWEELPAELVDWEATARYEEEREAGRRRALSVAAAERRREEERTPTVAPGLRLPEEGGVFLLDGPKEQPRLVGLGQSGGRVRGATRGNILRSSINPLARARQTIELPGARASVQAQHQRPEIYINLEGVAAAGPGPGGADANGLAPEPDLLRRYRLVRLERKRDTRVAGNLRISSTGQVDEERGFVEATTERLSPYWVRVRALAELEPGEYALVELLTEQRINLFVWDFGISDKP